MQAAFATSLRYAFLGLLLLAAAPVAAQQQSSGQSDTAADGGQSRGAALEQAYKKEFAFLAAQRRDLQQRLAAFKQRAGQERQSVQREIDQLQGQVVRLENEAEQLQAQVREAERAVQSNQDNQQVLDATFQQAEVTLEEHGVDLLGTDRFESLSEEEKIRELFAAAGETSARLGSIRESEGSFFLTDGTKVDGTIIRVGAVAAYGVSDQAAGALAPAGGGRFKLWPASNGETARALASGESPQTLPIFLFESLNQNVETEAEENVVEHIQSGGSIAWIIMGLGALALLLILLRVLFLSRASSSTDRIEKQVGELVRQGKTEEAQAALQKVRGSASRVVATALRNLKRDRQHLEDLISEGILREQGTLNRFGAVILMIAAVTPLLGLLGTVTGMISTFDVITKFGTGDPKLLSGGISTALVTTELGLAVAIPTLLIGNLLSGWAERIKDEMEKAALRVTNLYEEARA